MHKYDELEKLYYKNKIKKYTFYVLFIIVIFLSLFYINTIINPKTEKISKLNVKVNLKKITNQKSELNVTSETYSKPADKKTLHTKKTKDKNKTKTAGAVQKKDTFRSDEHLTPNLSFVLPKIKNNTKEYKSVKRKEIKPFVEKNNKTLKAVSVIKEESINIQELIDTFKKEPKYDIAIIISRYFFNKKDYKSAKIWALKANNINPHRYESWKMFALILLKKNDKIKAKKVLKIYLNDYGDNEEIYKLLRSIDE